MNLTRHLLCFCLLSQMMTPAFALSPPPWLTKLMPWKKTVEVAVSKRVSIGNISGGTGQSARQALETELTAAREFNLTLEKPDFIITGTSVGGRMSGIVTDPQGKEVLARTYAAPGLDENIKAFADELIFAVTGKPGLATSRIVFVSDKTGTKQVFIWMHRRSPTRPTAQVSRPCRSWISPRAGIVQSQTHQEAALAWLFHRRVIGWR
jgi:TolB protein